MVSFVYTKRDEKVPTPGPSHIDSKLDDFVFFFHGITCFSVYQSHGCALCDQTTTTKASRGLDPLEICPLGFVDRCWKITPGSSISVRIVGEKKSSFLSRKLISPLRIWSWFYRFFRCFFWALVSSWVKKAFPFPIVKKILINQLCVSLIYLSLNSGFWYFDTFFCFSGSIGLRSCFSVVVSDDQAAFFQTWWWPFDCSSAFIYTVQDINGEGYC